MTIATNFLLRCFGIAGVFVRSDGLPAAISAEHFADGTKKEVTNHRNLLIFICGS